MEKEKECDASEAQAGQGRRRRVLENMCRALCSTGEYLRLEFMGSQELLSLCITRN